MKNPINSIHYMNGAVVVYRQENNHQYAPTPTSLKRLSQLLRRITPFKAIVQPYHNGWSVIFHETVYRHLNEALLEIVNNGGGPVCSPPRDAFGVPYNQAVADG